MSDEVIRALLGSFTLFLCVVRHFAAFRMGILDNSRNNRFQGWVLTPFDVLLCLKGLSQIVRRIVLPKQHALVIIEPLSSA